jgi:hypothetical protein
MRVQQELDETKIVLVRLKYKAMKMASPNNCSSTKQLNRSYNVERSLIIW